ncbi:MAG: hydroxyacid dehydrogenase [Aigarchaeota archaeon]|nr:hydroxyacid dehydrogenase [Aigarchaeota archaeon]MDW8092796.1 hydroxyacid dehydrogenase [Nitrososphaerota archaeon]
MVPDRVTIVIDKESNLTRDFIDVIEREFKEVSILHSDVQDVPKLVRGSDVVIAGPRLHINRDLLSSAPTLKLIARTGVGLDNVDLKAATELGIAVTNVGDVTAESVAEHTIALIFSLAKNIPLGDAAVRRGDWGIRKRISEENIELNGKTLGVIGLGRIGSRVAIKAKCIGMRVVYYDVERKRDLEESHGFTFMPLEEVLSSADVISIHLPLTERTKLLINKESLGLVKPSAMIINQSRGEIVDDKALYESLSSGRLRGYATDVYSKEPPPTDLPLFGLTNVVCTPHVGASTRDAKIRTSVQVAKNVVSFFRGDVPPNIINPEVLSKKRSPFR